MIQPPLSNSVEDLAEWYQQQCVRRCWRIASEQPGEDVPAAAAYGGSAEDSRGAPSWIRLPVALHAAWSHAAGREADFFDILWGQYALFLAIRLQDDLLDGQRADLRLQFLGDRFIVESLEALQPLRQLDDGFWRHYRDSLRTTAQGIVAVARLQSDPGSFGATHLSLHAAVNAVFGVGTAAVCCLHGRAGEMEWIGEFQAQLAIFDQILDDLEDVEGDVAAARYTFVGNTLMGATPGEPLLPADAAGRLTRGFLDPARADPIWAQLRTVADRAAALVPVGAPPEFQSCAADLQSAADRLPYSVHRSRVRFLFGAELTDRLTHTLT